jgi:DNA-binding beta-propeller fold protein YncE
MRSILAICLLLVGSPPIAIADHTLTPVGGWPLDYTHSALAIGLHGSVFAADGYYGIVRGFSPLGYVVVTWGATDAPRDMAIDPTGLVYLVYGPGRVEVFTSAGVHVREFSDPRCDHANSIALDLSGNIYVGSRDVTSQVSVFDPAGKYLRGFPTQSTLHIAVDASGNVYAGGGSALEKYSATGELLAHLTSGGDCTIQNLQDFVIDQSGHVIVANFTHSDLFFLSADLTCLKSWIMPAPEGEFVQQTLPVHLAYDEGNGRLYVQDVMFDRVVAYAYDMSTPVRPATWGSLKARYR